MITEDGYKFKPIFGVKAIDMEFFISNFSFDLQLVPRRDP